jgi:hypothetical protein
MALFPSENNDLADKNEEVCGSRQIGKGPSLLTSLITKKVRT